jgi:hypothetical protein
MDDIDEKPSQNHFWISIENLDENDESEQIKRNDFNFSKLRYKKKRLRHSFFHFVRYDNKRHYHYVLHLLEERKILNKEIFIKSMFLRPSLWNRSELLHSFFLL